MIFIPTDGSSGSFSDILDMLLTTVSIHCRFGVAVHTNLNHSHRSSPITDNVLSLYCIEFYLSSVVNIVDQQIPEHRFRRRVQRGEGLTGGRQPSPLLQFYVIGASAYLTFVSSVSIVFEIGLAFLFCKQVL